MKTEEQFLRECISNETYNQIHQSVWTYVCRAMRLYSDQQNKELREKVDAMQKAVFVVTNPNAEIQRLTKEVEKWRERHSAQVGRAFEKTQEITRLRELLGRAKEWIYDNASEESTANDERQKLLSEINELNHKP